MIKSLNGHRRHLTWVVGEETKGEPAAGGDAGGVPLNRVDKIEVSWVLIRVEISKTFPDDEEIKSMEMKRVTLRTQNTRPLQNDLHARIKRQHHQTRTVTHKSIIRRRPGVIERKQRLRRKISPVNPISPPREIGLHNRRRRKGKRDIVDRSGEFRAIGSLTRGVLGTGGGSKSDGEEKFLVHRLGNIGREFLTGQRP